MDPRDAKGPQAPAAYSETLYGYNHFGVSSLRALRSGRYKYIDAPRPELYDLTADPGETRNLYHSQRAQAQSLHERLLSMRIGTSPGPSPPTPANADDMRRLRSLGYLGSSPVPSSSTARLDPKDRIAEYEKYGQALSLASAGRLEQSNAALEQLLAKLPDLLDARIALGVNKQRRRRHDEAIDQFQLALKRDSSSAMARFNLAVSYFALNRLDDATREAEAALRLAPHHTRADELLGTIYVRRKQHDRAAIHFNRILEQSPDDYNAHHNLGVLATIDKKWTGAEEHLSAAVRIKPASVEARNSLGSLYLLTGRLDEAANAFSGAIRLAPKHGPAYYNLGLVLRKQGKTREAAVRFREALALNPGMTVARAALTDLEKADLR